MRGSRAAPVCLVSVGTHTQRRWLDATRGSSGERPSARNNDMAWRHPLAAEAPNARSVHLPETVHRRPGTAGTISAEAQAKRVRDKVLRRYEEEMLWSGDDSHATICSHEHWLVGHFHKLRTDRRYRYSNGMMVVAGRELMRELHELGHKPQHLIVRDDKEIPEWAGRGGGGDGTQIIKGTKSVIDAIAPGTDGYVGNFVIPEQAFVEELQANTRQLKRVLVLDNVDDPGTLGSMLRTATSLAYDCVMLTNHCADLYDHRVVAAGRGVHFQDLTKFYVLRDTDGDDTSAMLNHVVERNNLDPVVYSPRSDVVASPSQPTLSFMEAGLGLSSTAAAQLPSWLFQGRKTDPPKPSLESGPLNPSSKESLLSLSSAAQQAKHDAAAANEQQRQRRLSLHQYCMDFYTERNAPRRPSSAASQDVLPAGHMVIAGPDHRCTLAERMQRRLARPTTVLELEEPSTRTPTPAVAEARNPSRSLSAALPVLLYQLREGASWDYALPQTISAESKKLVEESQRPKSADIGPDRPMPIPDFNETHEEYATRIRRKRLAQRRERLGRKATTSDADRWEELQLNRIKAQATEAMNRKLNPLKPVKPYVEPADDKYPDHIAEMREEGMDRDSLRDIQHWAENYTPPPNYDGRFEPPTPVTRKRRVVPMYGQR